MDADERRRTAQLLGIPEEVADRLMDIETAHKLYGSPYDAREESMPVAIATPGLVISLAYAGALPAAKLSPSTAPVRPLFAPDGAAPVEKEAAPTVSILEADHSAFEANNNLMEPTEHPALHFRDSRYASAEPTPRTFTR